ncbi:MAG TPA: response regulator transcription factor, partial [Conexibacter sp.]|nr:response regulator transcription factor [Conexibacter sp.]
LPDHPVPLICDRRQIAQVLTNILKNSAEAISLTAELKPQVVLMDVRMPDLDGIEATRLLQAQLPATRVLVVTMFHLDEYVLAALRAGASGYLLKDAGPDALVDAVRTVARGDALLSPSITRKLISHYVRTPAPDAAVAERLSRLTMREIDVVRLVAQGLTNIEIGARLQLSAGTIKTHVTNVLTKFGLRNRTQIVIAAYETGLVELGHGLVAETPQPPSG